MRYCLLFPAILVVPFLFSCTRDPEVVNNDPTAPQVKLEIISRKSAKLTIVSTVESSNLTYGGEIFQIVNGEERLSDKFETDSLDENHRYSWVTTILEPSSVYVARTFITNGRYKKYSSDWIDSTPSTSKPTLSEVIIEGDSLVAYILDGGGWDIDSVGFYVGDTPDIEELKLKGKTPVDKWTKDRFSLPLITLPGGKSLFAFAFAIARNDKEKEGYSSTPFGFISPSVESINFNREEAEVYIGETFAIEATVSPELFADLPLTWESSNPSVALVTEGGVVTPVGVGVSTITASFYSLSASLECTVVGETPIFPDEGFREYVYTYFDTNQDGFLSRQEVMEISKVDVSGRNDIYSLSGIESFDRLKAISCNGTHISVLDVSNCTQLMSLSCSGAQLSSLDVSNCTQLESLDCHSSQISSLDVSNCKLLKRLDCCFNQILSSLDMSNCAQLESLECYRTQISSLDVSNCTQLTHIDCHDTQVASLDLSNCMKLTHLDCHGTQISSLDVSNCKQLKRLDCCTNQVLSSLDVSNCTQLTSLDCNNTQISSLDVSNCTQLMSLDCNDSQVLSTLDVSNCTQLTSLNCFSTHISFLDVSNCTQLTSLNCHDTQISSLDVSYCTQLMAFDCHDTQLSFLDVSNCSQLESIDCSLTQISSLDVSDCTQLMAFDCSSTQISTLDVSSCTRLKYLHCQSCPKLTDIWLIAGHEYKVLSYDQDVATLHYL